MKKDEEGKSGGECRSEAHLVEEPAVRRLSEEHISDKRKHLFRQKDIGKVKVSVKYFFQRPGQGNLFLTFLWPEFIYNRGVSAPRCQR